MKEAKSQRKYKMENQMEKSPKDQKMDGRME